MTSGLAIDWVIDFVIDWLTGLIIEGALQSPITNQHITRSHHPIG
jgi:hypothetical protein